MEVEVETVGERRETLEALAILHEPVSIKRNSDIKWRTTETYSLLYSLDLVHQVD